jgi:hypothetical protein
VLAGEGAVSILLSVTVSDLYEDSVCVNACSRFASRENTYQLQRDDGRHIRLLHDSLKSASGEALAPGSLALVVELDGHRRSGLCNGRDNWVKKIF